MEIIEKYRVSILYCAPTAIRTFMKWGADVPEASICRRILGTVGEPINLEAYVWYRHYIGGDRTPVGHLVADGDRHANDLSDAGGDRRQTGRGDEGCSGSRG